jgi:hypothetical protein
MSFKLCSILDSRMKSYTSFLLSHLQCQSSLCPVFPCCISFLFISYLVTNFVTILVIKLTVMHCNAQVILTLLLNGPKAQE